MEPVDRIEAPPTSKAESILAAAKRTFLAAGFGAVSMDTIAREAGVSKATVYAHFAGKEELFGAVIGREHVGRGLGVALVLGVPDLGERLLHAL